MHPESGKTSTQVTLTEDFIRGVFRSAFSNLKLENCDSSEVLLNICKICAMNTKEMPKKLKVWDKITQKDLFKN